jgi:hypothetical protein
MGCTFAVKALKTANVSKRKHSSIMQAQNINYRKNQIDVFLLDFLAAWASDAARIFGAVSIREAL